MNPFAYNGIEQFQYLLKRAFLQYSSIRGHNPEFTKFVLWKDMGVYC